MQTDRILDFTLIYNKYKEPLYNYILKITRSPMLAEDFLHNVFLKFYQNIDRITDSERIEIWLFTTARNEIFSYFRRKSNSMSSDIELAADIPAYGHELIEELENQELVSLIRDELQRMDKTQSEVYILKEFSGLSYKSIAGVMGITEDLVKSRLFKVRQKLKEVLIRFEME